MSTTMSRREKAAERIVEYFSKDPTQWNGKRNGVKPEVPRLKDNAHLPNGERRKAIDDALTYLRHELVQIRIEDQELHGHLLRMRKAMNSIKKQARLSMPPGALPSYDFTATPESGDDDDDDDVAPLPSQQTKSENRPRSRTAPALKVEKFKFKSSHGASKSFDELDETTTTTTTTKSHLSPLDSIDRNLSASYDCLLSPPSPSSPRTIGFDTIKFSSSEYSLLNRVAQEVDEARRGNFGAAGSPTLSLRRALLSNKEKAIVTKTRTPPTNRSSRSRPTSSSTPSIKVQAPPPPPPPSSFPSRAPPIKRTLSETGTDPTSSVVRRGSAAPAMKTIRDDDDDDRDSSAFLESPLTMRRNKSASLPRGGTDAAAAEIVVKKMQEKLAQERRAHLSRSPSVQRKFPGATTMERRGGGGVDGMSSSPPLRLRINSGISHSRSENVLSPITGESSSAASRRRSSDLAHSPDARFAVSPPPSYSSHQGTDL